MGRKLQAAIMAADSTYILAGPSGQEVQRSKAANQSIVPKPEALARPGVFRFPGARVTGNVGRPEEDPGNRTWVLWKNSMLP